MARVFHDLDLDRRAGARELELLTCSTEPPPTTPSANPGCAVAIILAIPQAAADVRPAKIGWGAKPVDLNRNRHSKIEPQPVDRELGVIRLDGLDGNPIAVIVNFAAHPTMLGELKPRLRSRES